MIESFASLGMGAYLVLINLLGLGLMAFDKSCARRGAWRIPERALFGVALLGGSAGTWAGMSFAATRPATGILLWGCR